MRVLQMVTSDLLGPIPAMMLGDMNYEFTGLTLHAEVRVRHSREPVDAPVVVELAGLEDDGGERRHDASDADSSGASASHQRRMVAVDTTRS